jgi:hypothetical protein
LVKEVADMRYTLSKRVAALALCAVGLLAGQTAARAATIFDEKQATALGQAVVAAAHPTAKGIAYLEHKESVPKPGRVVLDVRMKYFGKVTSAKYTANVRITIDTSKDTLRVLDVEYKDDNKIPASKKNLRSVETKLTNMLPKKF